MPQTLFLQELTKSWLLVVLFPDCVLETCLMYAKQNMKPTHRADWTFREKEGGSPENKSNDVFETLDSAIPEASILEICNGWFDEFPFNLNLKNAKVLEYVVVMDPFHASNKHNDL